MEHSQKMHL